MNLAIAFICGGGLGNLIDRITPVSYTHLKRAGAKGITMDILLQVNSAQEESKFGITTAETEELIHEILENCENIRLRGLMCVCLLYTS